MKPQIKAIADKRHAARRKADRLDKVVFFLSIVSFLFLLLTHI